MAQDTAWGRLAWQGIAFDVPADWCPSQLQGDFKSGYLRVEDELRVRLELRWESLRKRLPEASDLVDNFLRQTRKKLGRRQPEPDIVRGRSVPALEPQDHEVFTWRGSFNAHSLLLVCAETRRVVHLRVFFEAGDEQKALTRRVFASVSSGPQDGQLEWNVFDLGFRLDADWRLESSALRTGCLELAFREGRDELVVARYSLAELSLREATLKQWLARTLGKPLRGFRVEVDEEASFRQHAALRFGGRSRAGAKPLGLFRRRRHLTGLAWHCPEADKIFAVRAASYEADDPRVAACAETIACH
jgi:hypothetical protein